MTQLQAQKNPLYSVPPGTYHGSGPVCDIHTYFGPGGAEVTFTRKYALGGDYPGTPIPLTLNGDELEQVLRTCGEEINIAPRGRAR
ncbi:hypothetical protein [Pseudomonas baetica]|uniref:hypothetical protein n=1 Tax=Pseudomonas baetica TaxID=674054 RepID=UPI0024055572|nr:hypothetical protein [Pseudomonas baetica]MDF9778916.1 hypothetical protein [Pseudomonas baetica]